MNRSAKEKILQDGSGVVEVNMESGQFKQSKEIKKEIVAAYARCLILFSLILGLRMILVKLFVSIEDIESLFKHMRNDEEISSSLNEQRSILGYWFHNSIVNLIYILLGFVPFLYISRIGLCVNSILQGVLCAFLSIAVNKGLLVCFIYGYGVHGIIENLANILGFTLGILICRNITKSIKEKTNIRSIGGRLKYYIAIYCSVIIPILLIAAILEAKVTPIVLDGWLS